MAVPEDGADPARRGIRDRPHPTSKLSALTEIVTLMIDVVSDGKLFRLYRNHSDRWWLLDNATADAPLLLARGSKQTDDEIHRPDIWNQLLERYL